MYYGVLSRSLDQCTVLHQNSLLDQEFWLCWNYVGSGVCLFLDPLAGLISEGISTGIASGQSVSCEAIYWIDVAGVECLISRWVILGVGDALPCVNNLFGISSVVGEEMPSMSWSKSGASIWIVSSELMCGS